MFASGAASAQALQAYAGAVAGVAQGTGGIFACATSGPTIGDGWFAGLRMPTEGFAGCNLQGGIQNQTGTAVRSLPHSLQRGRLPEAAIPAAPRPALVTGTSAWRPRAP